MRIISLASPPIRLIAVTTIASAVYLFPPAQIKAAYLLSLGAAEAESNIVSDLQMARLDQSNIAAGVAERTIAFLQQAPPLTRLILQSPLKQICPVLFTRDGNTRQYAFRSIHASGKLDWIVATTGTSPEIIYMISVLPPEGMPPAVLPFLPSVKQDTITPSVEMGCSSEEQRKAAEDEIRKANAQFPMPNGGAR
jgi:hypothetical protein